MGFFKINKQLLIFILVIMLISSSTVFAVVDQNGKTQDNTKTNQGFFSSIFHFLFHPTPNLHQNSTPNSNVVSLTHLNNQINSTHNKHYRFVHGQFQRVLKLYHDQPMHVKLVGPE